MAVGTIHFVYPTGTAIRCPEAIGREVGARLVARGHRVVFHDWDAFGRIAPDPGDVLLGHPHPVPGTTFRRSMGDPRWARRIVLAPFCPGDPAASAFLEPIVRRCDRFLAVCGRYWFEATAQSPFTHLRPRMTHVDLAVDRTHFPPIKHAFAPPGQRRWLYIGHTGWPKNPAYLAAIAHACPEILFSWIGGGRAPLPGFRALGRQDFATSAGQALVAEHDFVLNVSSADANPATLLEAMAWGLIPVCTPESGYAGEAGIPNVPLDDVAAATAVIREWQAAPDAQLQALQAANRTWLDRQFTWDRFAGQVIAAVEATDTPTVAVPDWATRARLTWAAWTGPYSPLRPTYLRWIARGLWRTRSS